ncbi:hypothetical protein YC2023_002538 [Brassica napus]
MPNKSKSDIVRQDHKASKHRAWAIKSDIYTPLKSKYTMDMEIPNNENPFLFEKKKKIIENQSIVRLLKPRNTKMRSINTLNLYVAFATKTKKKGTTLLLADLATYDSA